MARPRRRDSDALVRDLEFVRVAGWEPPERLLGLEALWELPGIARQMTSELPIRDRVDKLRDLLIEFVESLSEEEKQHPPALRRSMAYAAEVLLRLRDGLERAEDVTVGDLHELIAQRWLRRARNGELEQLSAAGFRIHLQRSCYQRLAIRLRDWFGDGAPVGPGDGEQPNAAEALLVPFERTLILQARAMMGRGDFAAVLRYHDAFSRFLFVEGHLEERIELGTLVSEAGLRLERTEDRVAALVDDLGWTQVAAGAYAEAEDALRHGLDVAREAGLVYWQAKARRHLGGLSVEQHDYDGALVEYRAAQELSNGIPDEIRRVEFQAGIEHDLSTLSYLSQDLDAAQKHLEESVRLRAIINDPSRVVRAHALRGKILEARGKYGLAREEYELGIQRAVQVNRRDEQVRNLRGLARLSRRAGRISEARIL